MLERVRAIVRNNTIGRLENHFKHKRQEVLSRIPLFELSNRHIKNSRLIVHRNEMLDLLPKDGVIAEIGVDQGHFSRAILELNSPRKLYLIDSWANERFHQGKKLNIESVLDKQIAEGQVEIKVGLSTEVVSDFSPAYFDWVYIDTDHSYELTLKELQLYSEKVKPGGFICGHDFELGNWVETFKYGVIEAVYEFCVKEDWELVYLTVDNKYPRSFAIRKITE